MTVFQSILGWAVLPSTVSGQDTVIDVIVSSEPSIFPRSWQGGKIDATAEPLALDEVSRSKQVIANALAKYPEALLKSNLQAVYAVGSLGFSGIKASGTNSRDCVYLSNRGLENGFTDEWMERVFHSEFSSILLRNYRAQFPESEWNDIAPTGFRYGQSGVDAVRNKQTGKLFDEPFLRQGFVGRYAQSTLENDFNAIAGQLFLGSSKLWTAADHHAKIAQKIDLAIQFFSQLDTALNRSYFHALAKANY